MSRVTKSDESLGKNISSQGMPVHRTDMSCAQEAKQVMRNPKSEEPKGLNRSLLEDNEETYLQPKVFIWTVITTGDTWIIMSTLLSLTLFWKKI